MATKANYEEMLERVDGAIANKYWFEACWIQFGIFEDRIKACIRGAGVSWSGRMLGNQIAKLGEIIEPSNQLHEPLVAAQVEKQLLDGIGDWKDRRNPLMHNLATETRPWEDLNNDAESLALDGRILAREICATARRIKKHRAKVPI